MPARKISLRIQLHLCTGINSRFADPPKSGSHSSFPAFLLNLTDWSAPLNRGHVLL
jgi:hypothetical protein